MKRTPFFCANWKMNLPGEGIQKYVQRMATRLGHAGGTFPAAERPNRSRAPEVVLAAPFPFLAEVCKATAGTGLKIAAQNVHGENSGTFTGEVSAPMLRAVSATHVIVGHSERRAQFGETDEIVGKKLAAVLAARMTPILCVGETWADRKAGKTHAVVRRQLSKALSFVGASVMKTNSKLIIAYEPVWAISSGSGHGRTATPQQAQEVHTHIRSFLAEHFSKPTSQKIRILYGGSVNSGNAAALLSQPDIDGALVGGASLQSADFAKIVRSTKP